MNRRACAVAIALVAGCGGDDASSGPTANGTLGAWTPGPTLPVARANHASAVVGTDLLVIGGNRETTPGTFVATDLIHAAAIGEDGALAPWREVGRLPSPASECSAAAWNTNLVVVDGLYDDPDHQGQVWLSVRGPDGTLGAFVNLGALPTGLRAISSEAWIVDNTLYVTSGQLPPEGDTLLLLSTPLSVTPLVWTTLTIAPAPAYRGQPQYVFTGDAIHVLGGYQGPTAAVLATTVWASLAAGVATPRGAEPPLLAPTGFGEAIAVDGFGFLVGGKATAFGVGVTDTAVTTIGDDGALGTWTASTPLPVPRTNHDLALGPTHLYLTGGGFDSGGLDTVYSAQVRF